MNYRKTNCAIKAGFRLDRLLEGLKMKTIMLTFVLGAVAVGQVSCIQLRAPKEEITINLNVRIDQEVRVQLQGVAEDIISDNPDLF